MTEVRGILGSAAAARTSGVLHGLPKRISSGVSRPTVCTRELYQAAGVRLLSPSSRIFLTDKSSIPQAERLMKVLTEDHRLFQLNEVNGTGS